MELLQLLVVALIFEAEQLVAGVEQVLGAFLWVESLVFLDLFLVHFQDVFLGVGRNTYHARLLHNCSRNNPTFLVVFAAVHHSALFLRWGVELAS